jgi:hypothetical protein
LALDRSPVDQIAQIVQWGAAPNARASKRKCFLPYPALRHARLDPLSRPRNQKLHASSTAIRAEVSGDSPDVSKEVASPDRAGETEADFCGETCRWRIPTVSYT